MLDDKIRLQNLRSADVLSGSSADPEVAKYFDGINSPKLPRAEELEFGEIALNIATGYEVIAIKTYGGRIVYLPFNLAEKVLSQQASIDEFKDEIITDFNTLSALTQTQLEQFIERNNELAEMIYSISGSVDTQVERLDTRIDSLSGDVFSKIDSTRQELEDEIAEITSGSSSSIAELERKVYQLSGEVDTTVEEIEGSIQGVSGKVDTQVERLDTRIDSLSASTDSAVSELSGRLDTLSGRTGQAIELISQDIENQREYFDGRIDSLSAETREYVDTVADSINQRIDGIESGFGEAVNEALSSSTVFITVTDELREAMESGDTSLLSMILKVMGSVGLDGEGNYNPLTPELSGMTVTEAIDRLAEEIEDIETHYPGHEEIEALSGLVMSLSAATDAGFQTIGEVISEMSDEMLSGFSVVSSAITEVADSVATETSRLDQKIDSVSSETSSRISENTERIERNTEEIASIKGELDGIRDTAAAALSGVSQVETELNDRIDELSADTDSKIGAVVTYTTDALSRIDTDLRNVINETAVSVMEASRDYTDDTVAEAVESSSAATVSAANRYTDQKAGEVLSEASREIAALSASTDQKLANIGLDDLKDVEIGPSTAGEGDVEVLGRTVSGWTNTKIGYATDTKAGLVIPGSGLTVDHGVVSVIEKPIDDVVTSGSSNAVSSRAVFNAIQVVEDHISDVEEEYKDVADEFDDLKDTVYIMSGETAEKFVAFSASVETHLNESDMVQAATLAKQNFELGFTKNAEFRPESEGLHGRNVTDAIDYIYSKAESISGKCIAKYDTLEQIVIDDELTTAGAVTKINHYLGFNNNAQYVPYSEPLQLMNVTEAIDYLYDRLEDITDYVGSEKSMHLMRSVTYEKLVDLKKKRRLRWGMVYRITNYQATVSGSGLTTRVEVKDSDTNTNNGFDIIVRATSNDTLNENVMLMDSQKGGQAWYFEDCAVSSWQVKYCLDNDRSRFSWANPNGFGVIYYMRDNYGNEAPYDFKNILFTDEGGQDARFTFGNKNQSQSGITYQDFSNIGYARDNVIRPAHDENGVQVLNRIVFRIDGVAIGNEFAAESHDILLTGTFRDNKISSSKSGQPINSDVNDPMEHILFGYQLVQ